MGGVGNQAWTLFIRKFFLIDIRRLKDRSVNKHYDMCKSAMNGLTLLANSTNLSG